MELCSPGSKGHNRAVVVRACTDGRSLVDTCATNRVGTEHVTGCNIEQVDLATKPAVHVVASESAHSRTVMGDSGGPAKPETRPGEVNNLRIGGAVECIDVEIEAAYREYAAVTGDRVENISGAGACDAEDDVAVAGVDKSGFIILRHEGHRTVIGQSYSIHPKWICPHECDRASISVKDIQRRILSHRIAHDGRHGRAVARHCNLLGI